MVNNPTTQPKTKAFQVAGRAKNVQAKAARFDMSVLLYVLVFALLLGSNAFWHFVSTLGMPTKFLISLSISTVFGIIHLRALYRFIDWTQKETYWKEFLVTAVIGILATVVSALITDLLIYDHYLSTSIFFGLSFFGFLFPYLFYKSLQLGSWIPLKEYNYWLFPKYPEDPTTDWNKLDLIKADLVFTKGINEETVTTATVRVPLNAKFGEFIPAFVENYNENTNPEYPIGDLRTPDDRLRWQFIVRTTFGRKLIDPDKTVHDNELNKLVKKKKGETIYPNIYLRRVMV